MTDIVVSKHLRTLTLLALTDSDAGRAARAFLFWLAGERETLSGLYGGIELKNLDPESQVAAMAVFGWLLVTKSLLPLYECLQAIDLNPKSQIVV